MDNIDLITVIWGFGLAVVLVTELNLYGVNITEDKVISNGEYIGEIDKLQIGDDHDCVVTVEGEYYGYSGPYRVGEFCSDIESGMYLYRYEDRLFVFGEEVYS